MHLSIGVLTLLVAVRVAAADDWVVAADARAVLTIELDGGAPMQRTGVVPAATVLLGRVLDPVIVHTRLRLGLPAFYGQIGAGAGAGVETALDRRPGREIFGFVLAEAGVQLTYYDAPPEVQYHRDALVYWGIYGRVEAGVRVLVPAPSGRPMGMVVSIGTTAIPARYLANVSGRGTRLEPDVGVGGEFRF